MNRMRNHSSEERRNEKGGEGGFWQSAKSAQLPLHRRRFKSAQKGSPINDVHKIVGFCLRTQHAARLQIGGYFLTNPFLGVRTSFIQKPLIAFWQEKEAMQCRIPCAREEVKLQTAAGQVIKTQSKQASMQRMNR